MLRFSSVFRLVALGVAIAQFALAGALPMLDAQIEIQSQSVVQAHFESSTAPCGVLQHAADCVICNLLGRWSGPLAKPLIVQETVVASLSVPYFEVSHPVLRSQNRRLLPRAPPLA